MAHGPEFKVKKIIKAELKSIGAFHFFPATGGYGASGIPDVVGCWRGYFFALEAKAGRGKTTPLQDMQIGKIHKADGIAIVVNESNAPTLGSWLTEEILRRKRHDT
jgi:hypothetical protein